MDPNTPRQHNDKPVDQQNAARKENPKVSSRGPSPPEVIPSPNNPEGPRHCRYEPSPGWFRILEGFGIISVIIYTSVTWCMWRDSNRNFRVQERAWMQFDTIFPTEIKEDAPVVGSVSFYDSGNTFGKKITGAFVIKIFQKTEHVTFNYTVKTVTTIQMGILPPKGNPVISHRQTIC
jgi:hypothetical protein